MLGEKKTVLYISENTIHARQVNGKKDITVQWVPTSFISALKAVSKKVSIKNSRILLSEDISYISLIDIPEPDIKNRKKVQEIAQEVIPEELDQTAWDYIIVEKTIPKSKAQIIATTKDLTKIIRKASEELKVKFEVIEPIAYSLAQLTKSSRDPHIIIHEDKTVVIAHKGKVYSSAVPDLENIDKQLAQLIEFAYEEYGIEPNKVFLSTTSEEKSAVSIGIADSRVIKTIIDPFTEIALKNDLKKPDEELLNINISSKKKIKVTKKKASKGKEEKKIEEKDGVNKNLIRLLIISLVLAPILIGIILLGRDNTPKTYTNDTELTGSINDAINMYYKYTVLIKDNIESDIDAKEIKNILDEMGFKEVVIEKTEEEYSENILIEVDYKESVPTQIYDDIKISLDNYEISEHELLTEEIMYDLVLTVGTFN